MIDSQTLNSLIGHSFEQSSLPLPGLSSGKVRDWYDLSDRQRLIVTTDRAFGL